MLLLLPLPSWAGHWVITMVGATNVPGGGTGTYTFANGQVTGPAPFPMSFDPQFHPMLTLHASDCDLVYLDNGDINMSVIVKLTWTPDWVPPPGVDNSQPPPTVDVLETASAGSGVGLNQPTSVSTTADDGLGDAQTYPAPSYYGAQCSGKHLFHLVVPAGQMSVTLPTRSLSASLSWLPSSANTGGPGMSVNYAVQEDTRAVTISADCDTPVTYYKVLSGGVDANGDGLWAKVAHQRDSDGTMKADIGIPYGEMHTAVVIGVAGGTVPVITTTHKTVTYTAHIPGNWATQDAQYLWNSSLKKYSLSGSLHHLFGLGLPTEAEIPVLTNTYVGAVVDSDHGGAITANEAGTTGTPDHIFFKFQNGDNRTVYPSPQFATGNDGDGATATANYWLTVHQPIEVFPSNRPSETNHYHIAAPPPAAGDIPMSFQGLDYCTYKGTGSNGVSAICVIDSPSVGWSLSSDVTSALSSVPYPGWWGVLDVIFSGANIYIKHATPQSQNFPADFTDMAWNDPQSTGDSYWASNKGAKTDYHMSPRVRVQYRWNYRLVDVYDASGFKSETLVHDEEYIGPQNAFGYFTYTGPTTTP
jgi:hypothetical protein